MKYYVFNNKSEALDYDSSVVNVSNFPDGDNWANPIKHPTLKKWAILANTKVEIEGKRTETLTEDWIPFLE